MPEEETNRMSQTAEQESTKQPTGVSISPGRNTRIDKGAIVAGGNIGAQVSITKGMH